MTIREAMEGGQDGVWLLVFPASGMVRRMEGRLALVEVRGCGLMPAIREPDGHPTIIEPRVKILDDDTLSVAWEPRDHLHETHPEAKKWFTENPGVFVPGVANKVSKLV